MKQNKLLSEFINTSAKEYALSLLKERSIPSIIDGLKPVQRLVLYSAIENAPTKFVKLASVASRLSEYGYEHAETSASDAGCLMANTWSNNVPILDGDGSFGSRLIQKAAAARYIYCKLSNNFNLIFKDINISPESKNKEYIPPEYYLPIIPFVLLNGIRGMAKGYSTNILPHNIKSVTEKCIEYIKTGTIKENPLVEFPDFTGNIIPYKKTNAKDSIINGVTLEGTYSLISKTKLLITEVPYKYDREQYVELLDELIDNNIINSYDDECKNTFKFVISLKNDFLPSSKITDASHEKIMSTFKLRESIGQNITTIGPSVNDITDDDIEIVPVLIFEEPKELISHFITLRLPFYKTRIDNMLATLNDKLKLTTAKVTFIKYVIDETIKLKEMTKKQCIDTLNKYDTLKEYSTDLLSMNIYSLTLDEVENLISQQNKILSEINYYENTTPKVEYLKDLNELLKKI